MTANAKTEYAAGHGAGHYLLVLGVLLVLTFLTYVTGRMHLGVWALPLALGIAGLKAGLVVAFFMHLKDTRGTPLATMFVTFLFVAAMLLGVFADILFRFPYTRPDLVPTIAAPALNQTRIEQGKLQQFAEPANEEASAQH